MEYTVRPMEKDDWSQVVEIYYQGIQTNNATFNSSCPSFDACVGEDNPFYKEFVLHLQAGVCMDEDCLSLFECLAIFFRIRQLIQKERNLSDTESKLLHYFETCGEWQPQDPTIVSHWYWWRIPTLAMH